MKRKLLKKLRSCRAQWITLIDEEPICGALRECPILEFGVSKGWLKNIKEQRPEGGRCIRNWYHFTPKGEKEILQGLRETTCAFTGRAVR